MKLAIKLEDLTIGYDENIVIDHMDVGIGQGKITSIIGPNGSGKSTILKCLVKLLAPKSGNIYLDNEDISAMTTKEVAQKIAILLQKNIAPSDIKVKDLVYYGRTPYKKWYETKNSYDQVIVKWAMDQTQVTEFAQRPIDMLSGGESQRVWLAMALAQNPRVLLLDEPTTFLDIGYQQDLLELIYRINRENKTTIVMVLHDLNQASEYSDSIIVLKSGKVYAQGKPEDIIKEDLLKDVYGLKAKVIKNESNKPLVIPLRKEENNE